jgi:glucose/arabinose dehydrogenase
VLKLYLLLRYLTVLYGATAFISCSSDGSSVSAGSTAPVINPPAGEFPRIALQQITANLTDPVAITQAGDSRLFITLRAGKVVIWDGSQILATPFLDVQPLVLSGGEQGLLSVAFHPRYASNGRFFVNYTNRNGDTVIARYQISTSDANQADVASGVVLLTIAQPFSNHNGGQLQFGPDGFLYVGMGDGGSGGDPQLHAQRDDSLLGKMLRIDVDSNSTVAPFYAIAAGNPLFAGKRSEIWAKGLRNPWRFSFDRATGDLYIGDVGQDSREEVDFQPASSRGGENYGWNVMEGFNCFSTAAAAIGAPPCNDPRLTLPIIEYRHDAGNCSITGGYVYRGGRIPGLQGTYLYGDFCSGRLWGARRENGAWVVRELAVTAPNLTTFGEDSAGEIYLATLDGALLRIVAAP